MISSSSPGEIERAKALMSAIKFKVGLEPFNDGRGLLSARVDIGACHTRHHKLMLNEKLPWSPSSRAQAAFCAAGFQAGEMHCIPINGNQKKKKKKRRSFLCTDIPHAAVLNHKKQINQQGDDNVHIKHEWITTAL